MCEALVKLMEPEMKAAVKSAEENSRKEMISQALHLGSSAEDISRVMEFRWQKWRLLQREIV